MTEFDLSRATSGLEVLCSDLEALISAIDVGTARTVHYADGHLDVVTAARVEIAAHFKGGELVAIVPLPSGEQRGDQQNARGFGPPEEPASDQPPYHHRV